MKRFLFTSCFLILLASCSQTNLLTYKHRAFYQEESFISSISTFTLHQNICYNRPSTIDEEFCHELTLRFIDTTAAKLKRTLDLQFDTLIVQAHYGKYSVWRWSDEGNTVSGQIEIVKWDHNKVILKENIKVLDVSMKQTKRFVGKRTFHRKDVL